MRLIFVGWMLVVLACRLPAETPLDASNSWALSVTEGRNASQRVLNLRVLNEDRSGETGFVRLSEDGNDFVRGDGRPIRFWIVGTDGYQLSPDQMDVHTDWLAGLGVNMVRLHVTVCMTKEGSRISDVDEKLVDGIFRFIKSAKDNGIYVLLSPYYPHFQTPESWGLPDGRSEVAGLLFLEPKLQDAYRHWTRILYTRVNPYTGLPIKDDPTVAILQVQNEDSLFFWTAQHLSEHYRLRLGRKFSDWLKKKYGSMAKAIEAWGPKAGHADPLDDPAGDLMACLEVYQLTLDDGGPLTKRRNDTAEFLGEFQREFYSSIGRFLREELGCKQLLNATNWRTANDARLKALERYSYHALDVDAENEYVGSDYQHQGVNDNYRIDPGHFLVNESVLQKPFEMCTNFRQERGHPFIVTETAWKNPNRYQSEGPFLVAAYQSLTGIDGVAWFACQTPGYETDPRKPFWITDGQECIHKWSHGYPAMMAGFPANALLYRRGYLRQADPVVVDTRSIADINARKVPRIVDDEAYGDQRNPPELSPEWVGSGDQVNRVAFLIGPVTSEIGGRANRSRVVDFSPYFDPVAGTIRSATGQLVWDYRRELCTMDAPKAQGVTGFLSRNGGRYDFADLTIESSNDYATINVTSLDGQPLSSSAQVLVQVVTVNRLSGYQTEPARFRFGKAEAAFDVDGEQIIRLGEPPLRIANTEVALTMKNKNLKVAQVLDLDGYLVAELPLEDGKFRMPSNAIYAVLRSSRPLRD
jgi:hypothetical protein